MSNHNSAPQPTPPETPWTHRAEELYDQGVISAGEADIMSGVPLDEAETKLVMLSDAPVPLSLNSTTSSNSESRFSDPDENDEFEPRVQKLLEGGYINRATALKMSGLPPENK